ncbi:MAG: DUF1028 domain-containing protein [Planctomycetota bacterium]
MTPQAVRASLAALLAIVLVAPARATWSIVVLNRDTGELAVATSTCIPSSDISSAVPVLRVDYAAGAAQSVVLQSAENRLRIYENSVRGATPQQLLDLIESVDPAFEQRQFGIVAFAGPPVTHTGANNGNAATGVTGQVGPYDYAIQGNVLSGDNVVFECEAAFLAEPGDLGQKLVAAMEAARDAGGDGRCSCSNSSPTGCGSPPPSFVRASYNVFMAIARPGDSDVGCGPAFQGCASGDYYLRLNFAGSLFTVEPIEWLRYAYTGWRNGQIGRADHVLTEVAPSVPLLQADGATTSRVTVRLRDVDGNPLAMGGQSLSVVRTAGQAIATIGSAVDNGDGTHTFDLVATQATGDATYTITVDDGIRPVQLHPPLDVSSVAPSELHVGRATFSADESPALPLIVDRGATDAGESYRILGSFAGTAPGTAVGGVLVPLNRDRFFEFTLGWGAVEPFTDSAGTLDADGRAEARFEPRPGALAAFAGSTLSFSALIGGTDATDPASVLIVP